MISNRTVGAAIRRTLMCGAVAVTSFATSLAAAQNAPEAKPTAQEVLATIVVEGSRIQRPELEAATPMLALSQDAL
jgi:hypothetical protein